MSMIWRRTRIEKRRNDWSSIGVSRHLFLVPEPNRAGSSGWSARATWTEADLPTFRSNNGCLGFLFAACIKYRRYTWKSFRFQNPSQLSYNFILFLTSKVAFSLDDILNCKPPCTWWSTYFTHFLLYFHLMISPALVRWKTALIKSLSVTWRETERKLISHFSRHCWEMKCHFSHLIGSLTSRFTYVKNEQT